MDQRSVDKCRIHLQQCIAIRIGYRRGFSGNCRAATGAIFDSDALTETCCQLLYDEADYRIRRPAGAERRNDFNRLISVIGAATAYAI